MLLSYKATGSGAVAPEANSVAPKSPVEVSAPRYMNAILYGLVALGILLRLYHFFYNRSFFIDELYLNVNTIRMSFWELATAPFAYQQKAPIGYLWSVKLLTLVFGNQEKALRLFSLLVGIGSMFAFVPVARHFLRSWGVVAAVAILALSSPIIYHSAEAKQYCTELFTAVLALLLYVRYHRRTDLSSLLQWGLLGAVALWFSFSLIFVLASIAVVVFLHAVLRREWQLSLRYILPFGLWLLSFAVQYVFFISKYDDSGWLIDFFDKVYDGFMPVPGPGFSSADVAWYFSKPYNFLIHPLGTLLALDGDLTHLNDTPFKHLIKMGWLQAGVALVGLYALLRASKEQFALLMLPIVLIFLASAVRQYPIYGRFVLFIAPMLLIIMGKGVELLLTKFVHRPAVAAAALLLLLTPSLVNGARQIRNPYLMMNGEYNREALLYVNEHFQPGDGVYVFWSMRHAYEYYKPAHQLKYDAVVGSFVKNQSSGPEDYLRRLQPELDQLRGKKRIWFVYDSLNRDAIGDYVRQPAWFHAESFSPHGIVEHYFSGFARKTDQHRLGAYTATLFEAKPVLAPPPAAPRKPAAPARQPQPQLRSARKPATTPQD